MMQPGAARPTTGPEAGRHDLGGTPMLAGSDSLTTDLGRLRALTVAVGRHMDREAADWGVSVRAAWALAVGPLVAAGLIALTVGYRPLYRAIIEEDGIVEWAQNGALLGLAVVGALIAHRLLTRRRIVLGSLYLLAAVAAVFIFGEEISWGQRLLGWATPEELARLNVQGETNVHNIGQTLRALNLVMMIVALAAAALPVAWRAWAGDRARQVDEYLLVPPVFLASSFLLAAGYRIVRFTLVPDGRYVVSRYQEVTELAFYVALLAFAFLALRRLRRDVA
jgi:hypothetical protein